MKYNRIKQRSIDFVLKRLRKKRALLLRFAALAGFPLILLARPYWAEHLYCDLIFESLAFILIVLGVLGRLWSYLHICGRKSRELVTTGPYALCRNPLYFFSLILVCGIGLLFENLVVFAGILTAFLLLHAIAINQEERKLAECFDAAYEEYRRKVPRLIPSWRTLHSLPPGEAVLIDTGLIRKHILESMAFFLIVPIAEILERFHSLGIIPTLW